MQYAVFVIIIFHNVLRNQVLRDTKTKRQQDWLVYRSARRDIRQQMFQNVFSLAIRKCKTLAIFRKKTLWKKPASRVVSNI